MNPTELYENATMIAVTKYPYFAPGILKLKVLADDTIPTAAVNGVTVRVNPVFISGLTRKQRIFVVLHEWYHIMLRHHTRSIGKQVEPWRMATDFVINGMLKPMDDIELIPGILYDKQFDGWTEEQVYQYLLDNAEYQDKAKQGVDPGVVEPHPDTQEEQTETELQDTIERIEKEVQQQIVEGIQAAKKMGREDKDLERLLGVLVEPKVDWRSELQRFIQVQAREDYTFKRPNTRMLHTGFVCPTLHSEKMGALIFAIDTSGSVDMQLLEAFASELQSAFETVDFSELIILYCDTRIHREELYQKGDELNMQPRGGGGTDFRPPFQWAEQYEEDIAGLIYLTDGFCSRFAEEPDFPVLWAVYDNRNFNQPYGEQVKVKL